MNRPWRPSRNSRKYLAGQMDEATFNLVSTGKEHLEEHREYQWFRHLQPGEQHPVPTGWG